MNTLFLQIDQNLEILFYISEDKITDKSITLMVGPYKKVTTTEEGHDCPICLDKLESNEYYRKLPCSHLYHKKCIDKWFKENNTTCPVCRLNVI